MISSLIFSLKLDEGLKNFASQFSKLQNEPLPYLKHLSSFSQLMQHHNEFKYFAQ